MIGGLPLKVLQNVITRPLLLLLCDMVLGGIAYAGAWWVRMNVHVPMTSTLLPQERWDVVPHYWAVLLLTQGLFPYFFGLFDDLRGIRTRELLTNSFLACLLQVLSLTSAFYLANQAFPRTVILIFGCFNVLALTLFRVFVRARLRRGFRRVLILGETARAVAEIAGEILKNPWQGIEISGVLIGDGSAREEKLEVAGRKLPVLGGLSEASSVLGKFSVDQIIFASEESWKDRILNSLSQLQASGSLRIALVPSVFEIAIGRLRHVSIHDTPLIEVRRNPNEPVERVLKRAFDIVLSAAGLILLLPVWLGVMLLIIVSSGRPVFYVQDRVGRGGAIFRLYKFRTMVPDAERETGEKYAEENDPRVTTVGRFLRRFRLDELPQFVNILKGDMSFVGPRPERPGFVRKFAEDLSGYHERHKVKPGLTGLAQVRSYYHTAAENKLRYDLAYIYNYSFSLDLMVLLETVKVLLTRKGS